MRTILIILLTLITNAVFSQIAVKGIVIIEEDGLSIPGVRVTEKETDNTTETDSDGFYTINVKDSTSILIFSFVGCIDREISVNEQNEINTTLKTYVIYEAWDQKLRFFLNSGLIENPVGGQFEFSVPLFISSLSFNGSFSYQTNLKENQFISAGLGIHSLRLAHGVYGSIGVNFDSYYRNILSNNDISLEAFSIETLWWSRLPIDFIIGYSHVDFEQNSQNENFSNSGIILGAEVWIPKPLKLTVTGKVSICKDLTEYQAEIKKKFGKYNRIQTFAKYYNVSSYSELSIGIGIEFTYFFKFQNNEY